MPRPARPCPRYSPALSSMPCSREISVNLQVQNATHKMMMKWARGVNFINFLWAAFTGADHTSAKKTVKFSVSFALLGSGCTKPICKMMLKLTPVVSNPSFEHNHFSSYCYRRKGEVRRSVFLYFHFWFNISDHCLIVHLKLNVLDVLLQDLSLSYFI